MTYDDTDFDPNTENDGNEQQETKLVTIPREQIRQLERAAREGRKAIQTLAERNRNDGLSRAGLALNETQQKAFDNAYDGDYSVESLQQFAADMGWQASGAPTEDAQDMAALDRVNAASAGSSAPPVPKSFNDAIRAAAGRAG